jgi:predicted DNA-binding transcriptional regulator AlpA
LRKPSPTVSLVEAASARPLEDAISSLPVLLDSKSAAMALGLRVSTLYAWSYRGGPIQPFRLGNRLRWRLSDIRTLLEGASTGAQP